MKMCFTYYGYCAIFGHTNLMCNNLYPLTNADILKEMYLKNETAYPVIKCLTHLTNDKC